MPLRDYLFETQELIELLKDFNQKGHGKPLSDTNKLRKLAELACCIWDHRIQDLPLQRQPSEKRRMMDSHKLRTMADAIGRD
ncbi:hypothetical protein LH22_20340 [Pantoea rwandensis]|uniref:Uncharacterized protein n=2 Tax=Pantoea rwandensis TaxID=1076550 RepID=A0ABM5RNY7_9GAMM|nr:hypothetical protein LH22_20340 [Pantoea rwandensis]